MRTYFQISIIFAFSDSSRFVQEVSSDTSDSSHKEAIKTCIERQELESPYIPFDKKAGETDELDSTAAGKRKLWRDRTSDGEAGYS